MKRTACVAVLGTLFLAACHTITEELPTLPTKTPAGGVLTVPIPSVPVVKTPAPAPTVTPVAPPAPAPAPAPTPTPDPPPSAGGCGKPVPPDLARINSKVHIRGASKWTLDSTPIVGPDGDFCRKIGYTDGRLFCPVRTEGAPDRVACELYVVGRAKDTGRPGPTWYRDGRLCTGAASGCENHEENQFALYVYAGGVYQPCASNGICGQVIADR